MAIKPSYAFTTEEKALIEAGVCSSVCLSDALSFFSASDKHTSLMSFIIH